MSKSIFASRPRPPRYETKTMLEHPRQQKFDLETETCLEISSPGTKRLHTVLKHTKKKIVIAVNLAPKIQILKALKSLSHTVKLKYFNCVLRDNDARAIRLEVEIRSIRFARICLHENVYGH